MIKVEHLDYLVQTGKIKVEHLDYLVQTGKIKVEHLDYLVQTCKIKVEHLDYLVQTGKLILFSAQTCSLFILYIEGCLAKKDLYMIFPIIILILLIDF